MAEFAGLKMPEILRRIKDNGFDGIQFAEVPSPEDVAECRRLGMGVAGGGRVNRAAEAFELASRLASEGMECGTVHLGWGLEDDEEGARLIDSILAASHQFGIPLYCETHRATLFQDMWRTVQFVNRHPNVRFNGDFSHWYTGQEMVYGGFDTKLAFIQPVLDRVRFVHGRIGNPGCIQVDIGDGGVPEHPYVDHFKQMWTAAFRGFLDTAAPGDFICFAPELLAPRIYYARTFRGASGALVEESDRWQQSKLLADLARACFNNASLANADRANVHKATAEPAVVRE
jgi:sugar phosphate isomerase/epimerase